MNITVYLSASDHVPQVYKDAARELGAWIADHGHDLIYGGSNCGLMGILATSALAHGGHVTGVEPRFMVEKYLGLDDVSEMIVVETMAERKKILLDKADVCIAIPGGIGTLEEISEAICGKMLGLHDKKLLIYNVDGFYDDLKNMYERMTRENFIAQEKSGDVKFVSSLAGIEEELCGE